MTNEVKNIPALRFSGFEGEWEEKLIKDILEFENNRRKPVTSTIREIGNYPYYGASGIIDYVKDYIFNNERRLLIGEDGAKWGSFEESSFIATGRYWVNNHAHVAKSELNNLIFLNNLLNYKELRTYVTGNAPAKLTYNNLCNIPILLPSIEEQNKIGNFFIKLDQQIELEEQKLEKLEEQKKGYMQKIFSQELRFKNENGNNYPDWEVKKIGEIMDVASVKRIHQSDWTNEGVRFIRARDIVSRYKGKIVEDPLFISKERYEEYSKLSGKVKIGDLLVTGVGTIGVPLLINNEKPIYFKDGNIIWLKNEDNIDKNFLFYSFISRKTQNFIKSVAGIGTVGTYTISNAKKTPILLPVSIEQVKIGNFFNELDKSIKKQNKKVDLLKERKKGFLQKMFV